MSNIKRDRGIVIDILNGMSFREAGEKLGISKARVNKIFQDIINLVDPDVRKGDNNRINYCTELLRIKKDEVIPLVENWTGIKKRWRQL